MCHWRWQSSGLESCSSSRPRRFPDSRHRCLTSSVARSTPSFCNHKKEETMTDHKTGTREEWLAARLELLEAEKALTRRSDELARRRQELPWVRIDKEYRFETDEGNASLTDFFKRRSPLLIYHFMFVPA